MKKYSWTKHYPVDAQIVGEVIDALHVQNEVEFIKASRNAKAPTHALFEWDQNTAAQEYRLIQARMILSSLHVEIISPQNKSTVVKAFIKESNKSGNYIHVMDASDDDLSAEEAKCLRQAKRFKAEWSHIGLVRGVIAEIRAIEMSVARKKRAAR